MNETLQLTATDGHIFTAYKASPTGETRGAIVVIQEIFGLNSHIRSIVDGYAQQGFIAIAPALFDRVEAGIELGYSENDMKTGFEYKNNTPTDKALLDIQACVQTLSDSGKVGIVGYCWGGMLAYASAVNVSGLAAAIGYYGGGIPDMAEQSPNCPTLLHFAKQDSFIPIDGVHHFANRHPSLPIHIYDCDHGFNCDQRGSYHQPSAKLALQRTLGFLQATF